MGASAEKEKEGVQSNNNNNSSTSNALHSLVRMGQEKGFEVEQNKDYGVGIIDLVWNINTYPALPVIKCGFIVLRSEEGGGDKDWQDNQFSIRKIEEATMRGIRSGMDKVYLLADNEEMAKSISGKIEWLASFGSLIRLDAISLGLASNQQSSTVITPSQQRVPEGEKIRREDMGEREAKFDEYNRPKGERSKEESKEQKIEREVMLDEYSRPKDQKQQQQQKQNNEIGK
jgi:hypothetical protein